VSFRYRRLTNTVRIGVDGDQIEKDIFRLWIPASRRYRFEVGQSERHDVIIDISFPRIAAKICNPDCQVMIDGHMRYDYGEPLRPDSG
jgi:hypothetical protein